MNFSREDVLRELELLPVWKLRAPISTEIQSQVKTTFNTETQAEIKAEVKTEILPVSAEPSAYVCNVSDDKKWAFIWPASLILSASQSTLFKNILVALKICCINGAIVCNFKYSQYPWLNTNLPTFWV